MARGQLNPFRFVGPLPPREMIDRDDEAEDLIALALAGHSVRLVGPALLRQDDAAPPGARGRRSRGNGHGPDRLPRCALDPRDRHQGRARLRSGPTRALRGRVLGHDPALDPESVLLRLLELPAAIFERDGRRSLIVFDEIQDVLAVSGAEEEHFAA